MPVYEYLCEDCEGVFEVVRSIREAAEPAPCPLCDAEGKRLMPSTFTAFVMRKGYPRRIPDKGTYWHLGKEVTYLPKKARAYEHPQVTKPRPSEPMTKGDFEALVDRKIAERRVKRSEQRTQRELVKEAAARRARMKFPPRVPGKIIT